MKKIYILILFFAFFTQLIYSQFSSSSNYFPLQVGNKWFYTRFHLPAAEYTYLQVTITKDSIVNNKRIFYIHHYPEQADYWVRYDTADGILYYFYGTESPYIKLSANAGDTTNYICSGVTDTTFFNTQTSLKKFYKSSHAPHSSSGTEVQLVNNFGQTYYYEYSASFTTSNYLYAWLKGCNINGITYGDTAFTIGITQPFTEVPAVYSLEQNYPNPFNPSTNIEFKIPENSFVKLIVYDQLGREIEKLVDEELNPGTYKYDWNAADYPSGVYFYKLQAGEFVQTKKMVLIK